MKFHLENKIHNTKTTDLLMSGHTFIRIILFIAFLSINLGSHADIPPRPSPPRLVNDLADILTEQQEQSLERKLVTFNDTTSNQIAVVIVETLDGYDPNMYAYEIGESWQIGQKEFNNGVVVLVKPKYGNDRGRVAIQSGYGLEPVITDAITKRIIEIEMIPEFRNNDYYAGIDKATNVLMALAAGEISADGYGENNESSPLAVFVPFLIFIIIFILIRVSNAKSRSLGGELPFWTALWLGSNIGSSSGSWSSFSGGSSSGFGGGGFGGFGGGSFGGGGASGSW
jgi:uncharacterized protein